SLHTHAAPRRRIHMRPSPSQTRRLSAGPRIRAAVCIGHRGGGRVELAWIILIGFVAGLVAKMLTPGSGPGRFLLTAALTGGGSLLTRALGVGGSLTATYLGRFTGLYASGQSAGLVGAVVGSTVLLLAYHVVVRK